MPDSEATKQEEKSSGVSRKSVGAERDTRFNNLRRMLKQMMKDLDELQREEKQNG